MCELCQKVPPFLFGVNGGFVWHRVLSLGRLVQRRQRLQSTPRFAGEAGEEHVGSGPVFALAAQVALVHRPVALAGGETAGQVVVAPPHSEVNAQRRRRRRSRAHTVRSRM